MNEHTDTKIFQKIANCIETFKIKSENELVANPCIRDFSNRFLNSLLLDNLSFLLLFRVFFVFRVFRVF